MLIAASKDEQPVYRINCDRHYVNGAPAILVLQKDSPLPPIIILEGTRSHPSNEPVIRDERRNKAPGYVLQDKREPPNISTHSTYSQNHFQTYDSVNPSPDTWLYNQQRPTDVPFYPWVPPYPHSSFDDTYVDNSCYYPLQCNRDNDYHHATHSAVTSNSSQDTSYGYTRQEPYYWQQPHTHNDDHWKLDEGNTNYRRCYNTTPRLTEPMPETGVNQASALPWQRPVNTVNSKSDTMMAMPIQQPYFDHGNTKSTRQPAFRVIAHGEPRCSKSVSFAFSS